MYKTDVWNVNAQIAAEITRAEAAEAALAPLSGAAFTGEVQAALAPVNTNDVVRLADTAVLTTLLPVTSPPNASVGMNGDYAIEVDNGVIYGPKTAGAWPSVPASNNQFPNSVTSSITYNTAYQNTNTQEAVLIHGTVLYSAAPTGGSPQITLGVGPTTTPTLVAVTPTALTLAIGVLYPFTAVVGPSQYLLIYDNATTHGTATIMAQSIPLAW